MNRVVIGLSALALSAPCSAQTAAPIQAVAVTQSQAVLPRNTPVYLRLNDELNSKSSATKKGRTFTLTVDRDVILGQHVVIPRGSRASGSIVKRTRKGGFGKSGKLDLSFDYIEVGDHRIAIEGRHREEGEGNSTATIATFVFLSMIGSGFITGHSADIPAGTTFTAWTTEDVPVQLLPAPQAAGQLASVIAPAGVLQAQPLPQPATMTYAAPQRRMGNTHVTCETCR